MTWLALGLLVVALVILVIYKVRRSDEPPLDPVATTYAAIALHRIHRKLDVELIKREQRQAATQTRREIAEALDDEGL